MTDHSGPAGKWHPTNGASPSLGSIISASDTTSSVSFDSLFVFLGHCSNHVLNVSLFYVSKLIIHNHTLTYLLWLVVFFIAHSFIHVLVVCRSPPFSYISMICFRFQLHLPGERESVSTPLEYPTQCAASVARVIGTWRRLVLPRQRPSGVWDATPWGESERFNMAAEFRSLAMKYHQQSRMIS